MEKVLIKDDPPHAGLEVLVNDDGTVSVCVVEGRRGAACTLNRAEATALREALVDY